MQTTLRLEKGPSLWEMTLIAPEGKPPTLDFHVCSEVENALDEIDEAIGLSEEDALSCIAISSSSEKSFCAGANINVCLLYTSPSPRDRQKSPMPSYA